MAKHRGKGIAAIEYPTGMNQNGDPSQCWIKVKPDGRIDVFAGTADIGNGSKTIQAQIVAETIGVPYDWITYDNSNTDSSPVCTGTFASRATFVAGKAAEKAALQVKAKILEIAGKELEIDPADLEIIDGEVVAKGAPQTRMSISDVAAAASFYGGGIAAPRHAEGRAHGRPGRHRDHPATREFGGRDLHLGVRPAQASHRSDVPDAHRAVATRRRPWARGCRAR